MYSEFNPPLALRNNHVQTVLNGIGPKQRLAKRLQKQMQSQQVIIPADDGVQLLAEFDTSPGSSGQNLAVLLHGWEGSSQSAYQITTAWYLLELGIDVLRINFRDHGDSHHLNPGLFNSTLSPEVANAIGNFLGDNQYQGVFLTGYSLGGNFALRIAADYGKTLGLTAAIAVCPPINPAHVMTTLNRGWKVYEQYFFRKWSRSLAKKLEHFPAYGYQSELAKARTLDDLNAFFIPRFTGFADPESYYRAYALDGNRLATLQTPSHLIASCDDPIIPLVDLGSIPESRWLHRTTPQRGGHCGFLLNFSGHSWIERKIGGILLSHL